MKSKKILTILLSLAIMFTFMPAMAFATDMSAAAADTGVYTTSITGGTLEWSNKFSAAKATVGTTVTEYTSADIRYSVASDGCITAEIMENGTPKSGYSAKFYDLDGSTLLDTNGNVIARGYNYSVYEGFYAASYSFKLMLKQPSYITSGWPAASVQTAVPGAGNAFAVKATGKAAETVAKGESVTINTTSVASQTTDGGSYPFLIGSTPSATITINDGSETATADGWYVDEISSKTTFANVSGTGGMLYYDGAEHKILYKAGSYAVSYQKYDDTKGEWVNAPEGITYKDAMTNGSVGKFQAVWKDNQNNPKSANFGTLNVSNAHKATVDSTGNVTYGAAYAPTFGFKTGAKRNEGTVQYDYDVTSEQAENPASFVELTSGTFLKVDEEELMNYFNDFYEVKVTTGAADATVQKWTLSKKYDASKVADAKTCAELNKKYAKLLVNYGKATFNADLSGDITLAANVDADGAFALSTITTDKEKTVKVTGPTVVNSKDDDITFSGVTTKSFKAKKKTKKLAKAKSFQIAAVADSGNEITFTATTTNSKIKVSKTGKVTVKKGLKKGTYKVTVKAKTAAGNGYKAAKESKVYTIKIK